MLEPPLLMSTPDSESVAYNLHMVLSMYARESRAPFPMRRQMLMGIVRDLDPEAPRLETEVRAIQARLGTPNERPGDIERAKVVAHRLSALMCLAVLAQGVKDGQGKSGLRSTPSIPLPAGTEPPFAPA
jgi:hypothetical protein